MFNVWATGSGIHSVMFYITFLAKAEAQTSFLHFVPFYSSFKTIRHLELQSCCYYLINQFS